MRGGCEKNLNKSWILEVQKMFFDVQSTLGVRDLFIHLASCWRNKCVFGPKTTFSENLFSHPSLIWWPFRFFTQNAHSKKISDMVLVLEVGNMVIKMITSRQKVEEYVLFPFSNQVKFETSNRNKVHCQQVYGLSVIQHVHLERVSWLIFHL